tara:strand:- start:2943 stop:5537 length:2595 start_codon:yes stop_codon:yes gene_type:complete
MAETLISPGVLARENDQSQITSQPIQAGAAIIGPTVKGQVNIPRLITTYSEYQANFGTTFESGSANQSSEYTFLTSISAYNYFSNGGTSLIVTRVASGSFSPATSSKIANDQETGQILATTDLLGSAVGGGGGDATFSGVPAFTGGTGTGLTLNAAVTTAGGVKTTADQLLANLNAGTNPTDAVDGSYTVPLVGGTGTNLTASITVSGQTVTSITTPLATSGSGYAASDALTFPAGALSNGQLLTTQNILGISNGAALAIGAGGPVTGVAITTVTGGTVQTGTGATVDITSDGTNVSALTVNGLGTGYVTANVLTITQADLVTAGFAAAAADLTITLTPANVELSAAGALTLNAADLFYALTTLNAATEGTGYEVGDVLVIAAGALGTNSTQCDITLVDANIVDGNAFILESIGQGQIMNSTGAENSQGALTNGSTNNLRWEISSPNTSSGTFSVVIRQGNDNTRAKSVLESFTNVSLDPKASNYISRVIGDQTQTVKGVGTTDVYLQTTGSYANASRYVRVKEVNFKTPDYLDNSGQAKPQYTASIPVQASGTFGDAVGSILTGTGKYYDKITANDTQGLVGDNYTTAINLLANKDDYKYNIISTPGLTQADYTSTTNKLIANTENRGDNIVILDLELYAKSITNVTTTAASKDSSYAASYWPWCMVTDPDSGQRVWVPAGTLIPGVYANNDRTAEAWFAPAGINRGGLGQVIQAERKLTQANRDQLYINKVNPIATFPGRGVVVFGQKTLQNQASALDRVNVRRLLIALKNYISQLSDNLVFEQNTAATRNTFLSQVNPYLESVQQRQGLYAFKVVMNDSNNGPDVIDRNELRGAIYIQPTKTAEFIYLDFNILPTGAEFPA